MAEELKFTPQEIEDGKGIAWLSYFGLLLIIPLLVNRENKFVMAHVSQGLALCIVVIVASIVFTILAFLLGMLPVVGGIFVLLLWLALGFGSLGLAVWGIIMVFQGEYKDMPYIGEFGRKFKLIPE